MNRRNFIKSAGSIAAATTVTATAGCIGIGSGSSNGPNIDVTVTTSDNFDVLATHTEPSISVEDYGSDGETRPVVEYQIEPSQDKCVEVHATVRAFDDDGVVIDEMTPEKAFDAGAANKVSHTIDADPSNVSEIEINLDTFQLGVRCRY